MPERDRTGRKIAIVGGAGVLAWWLLGGGRGWAFGRHEGNSEGSRRAARPVVWIRATRIEVDGIPADLSTVVAKCREAGAAEVHATGEATTRVVHDVLTALRSADVTIYAPPDLAALTPMGTP